MQRRHLDRDRLIEEALRLGQETAKIPDGMARHLLLTRLFVESSTQLLDQN